METDDHKPVEEAEEPPTKKAKSEDEAPAEDEKPSELARFWKAVEDDPTDFTGWTYLLQHVDANGSLDQGRQAYDAFLFRYPYCYGYWKKYADFEKRQGTKEMCMAVFDRGFKAIPLSADLWIHYLNHVKSEYSDNPDFVRSQYERSLQACGREWRSDKLWDHYVKWENEFGLKSNVLKIYNRILANPTQGLSHQFEMFKDFVKENNPKEILDTDEFLALRKEVVDGIKSPSESDDTKAEAAPGEDGSTPVTEEENSALRDKIVSIRKKVFKKTEEVVQAKWKYEDNIKRPYFHMKPLERGQLKNWMEYLDHEIEEQGKEGGNEKEVEILFERCLIACALYEEFWLKYVKWTRDTRKFDNDDERVEKMRDIYERACTHHLPNKMDIHFSFSAFEESKGNFDRALKVLKSLELKHPEMQSLMLRKINLERRKGNIEGVHQGYQQCMANAKKNKTDLAVKYARFLRLQLQDHDKAKTVLNEALAEDQSNPKLYLQLLDVFLHEVPLNVEQVVEHLDKAISQCESPKMKHLFSQRKVEFLEDFGPSITELIQAQDVHTGLTKAMREAAKAEENSKLNGEEDKTEGSSISTIEGRTGNQKTNGSSGTTYGATNSASYSAQHTNQYQQYGSRYNAQYNNYYSGSYPGYGSYSGSSSSTTGY